MRKLLLASVAVLGGTLGAANAQSFTQAPAVVPTPVPFTLTPSPTAGPGTISVRINARLNFYMQAGSDSGRNTQVTPVAPTVNAAGQTTSLGSPQSNTKLQDYQFAEYARLYFNLDGIAGNGLKYGAFLEVRQDNGIAPGGGGGTFGSISGQTRSRGAMYFRNEGAYLGTDQLGYLRFGSTYQPSVLFATGTFENFNDGAWDGDLPGFFTGNTSPTWPFPDISPFYVPGAIVYVSPQFAGLDFSASFAPTSGGVDNTSGNCPYGVSAAGGAGVGGNLLGGNAPLGCDAASSSANGAENGRPRNEAQIYARYRGAFGPVGIAVQGGGIFSGKVGNNATPQGALQYDGYSLGDGGVILTFGGLAVGGHVTAGRQNGQFGLDPKGAKDSFAWVAGASYAIGPVIIGASYFDYMSAGNNTSARASTLVGNRNEWGAAAGGTYTFAPGMNVYLSYLYGHRKELGVDLLSGATASATGNVITHNNVQSQGVSIGTQFRW